MAHCFWGTLRLRRMVVWWPLLIILGWCAGLQDPGLDLGSAAPPHALSDVDPDFSEPIRNVTVPLGREAVLSCKVTELGHFKVGWMKAEDQTILTLHTKVVTHNSRISVSHDNLRTWQLHIRQVKETDRGCYMCQINTSVMKKQVGCVDVHVPPDIVDEATSSDVTVQEGENATLVCRATGHPAPRIVWRREDGTNLFMRKGMRGELVKVESYHNDSLTLVKLERKQMGAYLCIASNEVPPAVSKRITLNINFAPVVRVPNQLVGAPLGTDVVFKCDVEAFPNTINYWVKNQGEMLLDGRKHLIEEERTAYIVHLKLTIRNFSKRDSGTYTCVSTNSLGHADGTIRLYEIRLPTETTEKIVTASTLEVTTARIITEMPNDIYVTTVAPLQAVMEESVRAEHDAPVRDMPNELTVNSGARRAAARRNTASAAATLAPLLVLVLAFAVR